MTIVRMLVSRNDVRCAVIGIFLVWLGVTAALADVRLPAIFGDHMVLQQNQKDRVCGWADPDEKITVSIERQSRSLRAGRDGRWLVKLDPMAAGGPHTLTVKGKNVVSFENVMVGEVWVCSGQSNMELPVNVATDLGLRSSPPACPGSRT
jgi:sialate O-acetylesterase